MSAEPASIVREVHDEPHVRGSRVSVRAIRAQVAERGLAPEEVAERLGVSVADVHDALAYYDGHRDEMAAVEDAHDAVAAGLRASSSLRPPNEDGEHTDGEPIG